MSLSLILAFLWVLAATLTAFLPMRHQYRPGLALLIAAPLLIVYLGVENGWWLAPAATAGFLSMFRNPLIYLFKRATGRAQPFRRDEAGE